MAKILLLILALIGLNAYSGNAFSQITSTEAKAQATVELLLEQKARDERAAIDKAKAQLDQSNNSSSSGGGIPYIREGITVVIILMLLIYLIFNYEPKDRKIESGDIVRWDMRYAEKFKIFEDDLPAWKKSKAERLDWYKAFRAEVIADREKYTYKEAIDHMSTMLNVIYVRAGKLG